MRRGFNTIVRFEDLAIVGFLLKNTFAGVDTLVTA
jgi:hypothetical protein